MLSLGLADRREVGLRSPWWKRGAGMRDGIEAVKPGRGARRLWALQPEGTFLNHGAFGGAPAPVRAAQAAWRERIDAHPTRFFMDDSPALIRDAAAALARFVGAAPERMALTENVTASVGAVARSLPLKPGDRIVTTTHVYGAVRNALSHVCDLTGATVEEVAVPLPCPGAEAVLSALAAALKRPARLVVLDHVTSPSALVFPAAEAVRMARAAGAWTLVDGAHAAGMLDLDVAAVDADWYAGTAHKWLCAPRGTGWLAARDAAAAAMVRPLATGHAHGQGFAAEFDKIGTRDHSAWLSIPDAIACHEAMGGRTLRARNREVALEMGRMVADALGTETAGPEAMTGALVAVRLPFDLPATRETVMGLRRDLWAAARIDVNVSPIAGALWLRLSAAPYVEADDAAGVAAALIEAAARGRAA